MDSPYYTFSVTSLTRGWTYSAVEGDDWDPADDVVLVAPFKYTWAFANDQIPGPLNPFTADINLVARTANDVPVVEIGDLIQFDIRVGTSGSRIIAPPPMRVTTADITLTPNRVYSAGLSIGLVDLSPDWTGASVDGPSLYNTASPAGGTGPRFRWRERLAEMAAALRVSIGCPLWWADLEAPVGDHGGHRALKSYWWKDVAGQGAEIIQNLVQSHLPGGYTHTAATIYGAGGSHPSGYEYMGPPSWEVSASGIYNAQVSDSTAAARIEIVEASRKRVTTSLPFQFTVTGGLLTLISVQPASPSGSAGDSSAQLGLDALWCVIPATARRAREYQINRVELAASGQIRNDDGVTFDVKDLTYVRENTDDEAARGTITRQVGTDLFAGGNPIGELHTSVPDAADAFLADSSVLTAPWTYDEISVTSSLIPQTVAAWMLTRIAPRLPGETNGDGRLVRHVTVSRLADEVRIDGSPVVGFVTAGSLVISGGDMEWSLTTAPGLPVWVGGAPVPVTVGDVQSAGYGTTTVPNIDELITLADLDYVD